MMVYTGSKMYDGGSAEGRRQGMYVKVRSSILIMSAINPAI